MAYISVNDESHFCEVMLKPQLYLAKLDQKSSVAVRKHCEVGCFMYHGNAHVGIVMRN